MLDSAFKYKEELNKLFIDIWYDEKYKYYYACTSRAGYEIPEEGDWHGRQFVSLDSNGEIIGFIAYDINRTTEVVSEFGAINFTDNKITFAKDLAQVIDDVFCKFNHPKLEWSVVVGNPVEPNYDKMCKKYGGNIVGVFHKHYKLIDNKYYDEKMYELFREDYIKVKEKRNGEQ